MHRPRLFESFRGRLQRVPKDMYRVNPSSLFAFASAWHGLQGRIQDDVVAITQGTLPEERDVDPQDVDFAIDTISGFNGYIDDSLKSYMDDYETYVAEGNGNMRTRTALHERMLSNGLELVGKLTARIPPGGSAYTDTLEVMYDIDTEMVTVEVLSHGRVQVSFHVPVRETQRLIDALYDIKMDERYLFKRSAKLKDFVWYAGNADLHGLSSRVVSVALDSARKLGASRLPTLEQVFHEELNPGHVKHPEAAVDKRQPTFPCICVEDEEDEDE